MMTQEQDTIRRIFDKLDSINEKITEIKVDVTSLAGKFDLLNVKKLEQNDVKLLIAACQSQHHKKHSYPPPAPMNDKVIKIVVTALGLVGAALWLLQGVLL